MSEADGKMCKNCKFRQVDTESLEQEVARAKRQNQSPDFMPTEFMHSYCHRYPETKPVGFYDWCGEWQAKDD